MILGHFRGQAYIEFVGIFVRRVGSQTMCDSGATCTREFLSIDADIHLLRDIKCLETMLNSK